MSKIRVELKDKDIWKDVKIPVRVSRRGNCFVKYHREVNGEIMEAVLVWKQTKIGEPVFGKEDGKWVQVGRIDKSCSIFLGEGLSYAEYLDSPEGIESSRSIMESLRMGKWR